LEGDEVDRRYICLEHGVMIHRFEPKISGERLINGGNAGNARIKAALSPPRPNYSNILLACTIQFTSFSHYAPR
jgi:hypothetical protein